MALGEAAGEAAALAVESGDVPRRVDVATLQRRLLSRGAVLMYYRDVKPGDAHFDAVQRAGLRGLLGDDWAARPSDRPTAAEAARWREALDAEAPEADATRGEWLERLDASGR